MCVEMLQSSSFPPYLFNPTDTQRNFHTDTMARPGPCNLHAHSGDSGDIIELRMRRAGACGPTTRGTKLFSSLMASKGLQIGVL